MRGPSEPPTLLEPDPVDPTVFRPVGAAARSARTLTETTAGPRPGLSFLLAHPAHCIALGFGSGLSRFAPGTVGTLWAWLTFVLLRPWLDDVQWAQGLLLALALGWWACTVTALHLRAADPGCIVWDEIVAFWLVLWLVTPTTFGGQLAAFFLFRYFDAAKPGPVGWADQWFKGFGWRGGWGILLDDLVAAFCTVLVMALWRTL